jgi:Spy/CpxP family protein refolding chaperone
MSEQSTVPPMHPGGPGAPGLPRPRSGAWLMIVLGLVILICGNVIGAGAAALWLKQYLPAQPPPPAGATERIIGDMRDRYDLNEDQARKIREIMQRRLEALEAIRRDAQEKSEAEREKLRGEMKTVLTPDQYTRWLERFEELGARRGPPGGPGGGPGRPGMGGPGMGGPGMGGPGMGGPGMGGPGMGGRPGPLQPGQGPGGGRPGMGGGQGPGRPVAPGMGRGPGPEGGPVRPMPPEGRRGPQPGEPQPGGPLPGGMPPSGPEAVRPQEPPPAR